MVCLVRCAYAILSIRDELPTTKMNGMDNLCISAVAITCYPIPCPPSTLKLLEHITPYDTTHIAESK